MQDRDTNGYTKRTDSFNNGNMISLESKDARFLMTVPDLVMVIITPKMLKQTRNILKIDYDKSEVKQLFVIFSLSPLIPKVQVIHKRKLALHDKLAWSIITSLIPEICTANSLNKLMNKA